MSIISVIIPVHNTAVYLKKCIESVRNQTLKDIEIILVENLSTDGSVEICDEYARIDPRIKVLQLNVAGLSVARNEGMKVAKSPYFGFIDSDDHIEPEMYETLLHVLRDNDAGMSYCNLSYETEKGRLVKSVSNTGIVQTKAVQEALKEIFRGKLDSSFCSKLFKRELFMTTLFPEGFFFEDHSLIYKVVNNCHTVAHIDRPFYHYVQHRGSITHEWVFKTYYHHFLADYGRLEFIRKHRIFCSDEHLEIVSNHINSCLNFFRDAQLVNDNKNYKVSVMDMKKKLKELLPIKNEIRLKTYRRLMKMIYLAPFERLFHKFRNKIKGNHQPVIATDRKKLLD